MYEFLMYLFLISSIGLLIVLFFKRKFTRERYIFMVTSFIFTYASLIFTHIFYDNSIKTIIYSTLNRYFNLNLEIPKTDIEGILLSILLFSIISLFLFYIYKNWNGEYSKKDYELKQRNIDISLLTLFNENFKNLKIELYKRNLDDKSGNNQVDDYRDNKPIIWKEEVIELFKLISSQYKFTEDDLHEEESIYVSKYLKNDKNIAIYYSIDEPSDEVVISKINFLKKEYSEFKIEKFFIAIKDVKKEQTEKEMNGVKVIYRYRDEMINNMIDFDEYFRYIEKQYKSNEITTGDGLTIENMYVESKGLVNDQENDNIENFILDWSKKASNNHIALLGEYGQGKSTLSLKISYEMISNKYERIPIIIELRGKSPRNMQLIEIIASWCINYSINPKALMKMFVEGKLLLILEGFDEIDLVGDENIRQQHFNRLWEFASYKQSKIMITGRPNLFLNKYEREEKLHLKKDTKRLFYCDEIKLLPFDKDQIKFALRNVNNLVQIEILEFINNNKNDTFIDLISRPSTLYQVSILWEEIKIKENLNSSYIIKEFINHSYRRQNEKLLTIGTEEIKPVLHFKEREFFMIGIAAAMNDNTNQINLIDLNRIISDLYTHIPDEVSNDCEKILKERLKTDSKGFDSLCNDIRTFGILVTDFTKEDSFKFAHKSFLEYLKSFYYVNILISEDTYENRICNAIKKSVSDYIPISLTNEVYAFIAQQFTEKMESKDLELYDNKKIAYRLFESLIKIPVIKKFPRFFINIRFQYFIIFGISFFAVLLWIISKLLGINIDNYFNSISSSFYSVVLIVLTILFCFIYVNLFFFITKKSVLKLWVNCCKNLNVSEEELYDYFGKKNIEFINQNKIDSYDFILKMALPFVK